MARLPEQRAAIQRIGVNCGDCLGLPLHLLPGLKSLEVDCLESRGVIDGCAYGKAIKDLEDTGVTPVSRSKSYRHFGSVRVGIFMRKLCCKHQ
jgi:hypothetical protein